MKKKEYVPNRHLRTFPAVGDKFRFRDLNDFTEHDAIAITRREVGRRWGCDAICADGFTRYVWDGHVTYVYEREANG